MKKIILTLIVIVPLALLGQAKNTSNSICDDYDNNKLKNMSCYIGKTLYLLGEPEIYRKNGYYFFYTDYKKYLKTRSHKYIYKFSEDNGRSDYYKLAGKYFYVVDIKKHIDEIGVSLFENWWMLKLKEQENGDIIYTRIDEKIPLNSSQFVITDYYEKKQEEYIGKQFVLRGLNYYNGGKIMFDIKTGIEVDISPGTIWKCIDVIVDDKRFLLSVYLENDKDEHICCPLSSFENGFHAIFEKSKADEYKLKFGEANWNLILAWNVAEGFTEEMCILGWENPIEKRKVGEGEKWIYRFGYLYFENGKLSVINIDS